MKLSPHCFSIPGKNSASFDSGGIAVLSRTTFVDPMALLDIWATVCGFNTASPWSDLPWLSIMRTNFQVIAGRAIEAAATHLELGLLRDFERHVGAERVVRAAMVDLGQPFAHRGRDEEGRVVHAQRAQDIVPQVLAELLAARRLDHLSCPVDVDAVVPA